MSRIMKLTREDIYRLAGALEEMLRQNNARLIASRLENLRQKVFPENFSCIQQELEKYAPQLTGMRLAIPCFEELSLLEALRSRPRDTGKIPQKLTLGKPRGLLKLAGLYRKHTLRLEIDWKNGRVDSRAYLERRKNDTRAQEKA